MMGGDRVPPVAVRVVDERVALLDIRALSAATADALMALYEQVCGDKPMALVLNLTDVQQLDPAGVSVLIHLQAQAARRRQHVVGYGLNQYYRQVFTMMGLDERIVLAGSEDAALQAARSAQAGTRGARVAADS